LALKSEEYAEIVKEKRTEASYNELVIALEKLVEKEKSAGKFKAITDLIDTR